jgi:hypothetical protein
MTTLPRWVLFLIALALGIALANDRSSQWMDASPEATAGHEEESVTSEELFLAQAWRCAQHTAHPTLTVPLRCCRSGKALPQGPARQVRVPPPKGAA